MSSSSTELRSRFLRLDLPRNALIMCLMFVLKGTRGFPCFAPAAITLLINSRPSSADKVKRYLKLMTKKLSLVNHQSQYLDL